MRTTLAVLTLLAFSAAAHADDKFAADFLRRHPELKRFDPAAEALKAEVKAGTITRTEARKLMGATRGGFPAQPAAQRGRGRVAVPAGSAQALTPEQAKRMARMQRAARRRAMLAQQEAANSDWLAGYFNQQAAFAASWAPHY